jgi:hypothetical protein
MSGSETCAIPVSSATFTCTIDRTNTYMVSRPPPTTAIAPPAGLAIRVSLDEVQDDASLACDDHRGAVILACFDIALDGLPDAREPLFVESECLRFLLAHRFSPLRLGIPTSSID